MSVDVWFTIILFLGVWLAGLLILDASHRSHIAALKQIHEAELAGMRTYIRTLNRERKYLEAELAKAKEKLRQREEVAYAPEHIQWLPFGTGATGPTLPPSEEYDEK